MMSRLVNVPCFFEDPDLLKENIRTAFRKDIGIGVVEVVSAIFQLIDMAK
jgi:hypothetical protein